MLSFLKSPHLFLRDTYPQLITVTVTSREPHGVLNVNWKSPRELLFDVTVKLVPEVATTSRLLGPPVKVNEPVPPATENVNVPEPPFLWIDNGLFDDTTHGAGLGVGVGLGTGVGLGFGVGLESGVGLGSGVGEGIGVGLGS